MSQFFLAEVADEQRHAQFSRNKIVALGGEPSTRPNALSEVKTNKEMLEAVLAAEKEAIAQYAQRAKEAEKLGDKGLVVQLVDILSG